MIASFETIDLSNLKNNDFSILLKTKDKDTTSIMIEISVVCSNTKKTDENNEFFSMIENERRRFNKQTHITEKTGPTEIFAFGTKYFSVNQLTNILINELLSNQDLDMNSSLVRYAESIIQIYDKNKESLFETQSDIHQLFSIINLYHVLLFHMEYTPLLLSLFSNEDTAYNLVEWKKNIESKYEYVHVVSFEMFYYTKNFEEIRFNNIIESEIEGKEKEKNVYDIKELFYKNRNRMEIDEDGSLYAKKIINDLCVPFNLWQSCLNSPRVEDKNGQDFEKYKLVVKLIGIHDPLLAAYLTRFIKVDSSKHKKIVYLYAQTVTC
ncbi:MAG: hypothetical protein QM535_14985 [Limnohabitans sp.]|nr:hypothetical protein [Limnohabitans sp.]